MEAPVPLEEVAPPNSPAVDPNPLVEAVTQVVPQ